MAAENNRTNNIQELIIKRDTFSVKDKCISFYY